VRRVAAGAALAVAGIFWAAPALGDATITAGPVPNTYANKEVTIDQGQSITFQNSDTTAFHDVTADQNGPDGKALFQSETIAGGKSSPVRGVEYLTTGDYAFHCSVHPQFMLGTIHVTANGTPKPRTPDNPAPNPADKTPPDATVAILDSSIANVLKHRGLRVRLGTDEPARFSLTASSGKTKVATGLATSKGAKTLKLGLTKKGRSLLRHAKTVKLRLTAKVNDAADNKSSATASRTLR
jgi:plastocyanin